MEGLFLHAVRGSSKGSVKRAQRQGALFSPRASLCYIAFAPQQHTKEEVGERDDDKAGPHDLVVACWACKIALEGLRHRQGDNMGQKEKGNVAHGRRNAGGVKGRDVKAQRVVVGAVGHSGRDALV